MIAIQNRSSGATQRPTFERDIFNKLKTAVLAGTAAAFMVALFINLGLFNLSPLQTGETTEAIGGLILAYWLSVLTAAALCALVVLMKRRGAEID